MAAPPRTGQALEPVRSQREVAANARASHIVVGVWPKNVAAWKTKSGERPMTTIAMTPARDPRWARVVRQMATRAMTASRGVTSHGAPARMPSARRADVPGGYFARTHASITT